MGIMLHIFSRSLLENIHIVALVHMKSDRDGGVQNEKESLSENFKPWFLSHLRYG